MSDPDVLAAQTAYYRTIAPRYLEGVLDVPGADELTAALAAFPVHGDVLELACGPGVWTAELARRADSVTALDASPEMLALARAHVGDDDRVRFVQADLFRWRPERRYDVVFLGFWLSHVPTDRVEGFWATVRDALAPGGRVFLVDDAHRTDDELVEGPASETIERRDAGGRAHRLVKVPWTPDTLERRLTDLGWTATITPTAGPFYWGCAARM